MIRDMTDDDIPELRRIHAAQGIDYQFPDLTSPLFFVRKVFEDGGKVRSAFVLRICAEAFLLLDKEQEPQNKLWEMQELQSAVLSEAYEKGLDEIHAAIPEIGFDKRLRQFGWELDRPDFHLWSKRCDQQSGKPENPTTKPTTLPTR